MLLCWGIKVLPQFRKKVIEISNYLEVNPDFLMAYMAFETGESFSASVKNAAGSGAVGLIQFMPSTAKALGTTTEILEGMNPVDQLDYVAKYFLSQKGRLKNLEDTYMAILWPAAVGKDNDYILFDKNDVSHPKRYMQNAGLDFHPKDGLITKFEASSKVRAKLEKGLRPENVAKIDLVHK